MENKWIRFDQEMHKSATETFMISFFIPTRNIAGISIRNDMPTTISIMMVGDEEPTPFHFKTVEERNNKLSEIMRTEGSATGKEDEPHG